MADRMFSVVSRLGFLSLKPILSAQNCRCVGRDAKVFIRVPSRRMPDRRQSEEYEASEGSGLEDDEDGIQSLLIEEKKKKAAVKYSRLKKQMTPRGTPERTLTWGAMEQIRYLNRNHPEEWAIEDLSKGFSVNVDVILRVLKSKFSPPPQKKAKQDNKVMLSLRPQAPSAARPSKMGQISQWLPNHSTPAKLLTGKEQSLVSSGDCSTDLASLYKPICLATLPNQDLLPATEQNKHTHRSKEDLEIPVKEYASEDESNKNQEERWDGQVLSEENVEELMLTNTKCNPVVQEGKDFFDSDGNFLYRI